MRTVVSSVADALRLACGAGPIDSQETRLLASGVLMMNLLNRDTSGCGGGGPSWWWHGFVRDGEARLSV